MSSVEFVHPVIVGKRALPALALGTDIAATIGLANAAGWQKVYAEQIDTLGKPQDIAVGIDPFGNDTAVIAGLCRRPIKRTFNNWASWRNRRAILGQPLRLLFRRPFRKFIRDSRNS